MMDNAILWSPTRAQDSQLYAFMQRHGFAEYPALYDWSIRSPEQFWQALAEFCDIQFEQPASVVLQRAGHMADAKWFAGSTLNYAEHLLRHRGSAPALIFHREDGLRETVSFDELYDQVTFLAGWLGAQGVSVGDRVCGYMPNCPQTVVAMLATTSIGAVWSSCSPDFGLAGAADRFGQIQPKLLFAVDGYLYDGKVIDRLSVVSELVNSLPTLEAAVLVPFVSSSDHLGRDALSGKYTLWEDATVEDHALSFQMVPFEHPLFILFSSGTTGVPKCIVHGHGGTLLQHQKEHVLHADLMAEDRLFYFTTCGWMMWNWLVSALAVGTTLVLYDGAPFADDGRLLWRMAEREGITVFGTSAKYLSALQKQGIQPAQEFDLSKLRALLSTGSPLVAEGFDYVYQAIGANLLLGSISGGTDILGCFAISNPLLPVRRGEIQCRALGMAVAVYDEEGRAVMDQQGELVCTEPFPSMPVGFWDDHDGSLYRAAYFARFDNVWAHGDFACLTQEGGMVIYGRSDTVLNPGGVRIGTAEIYRQVEKVDAVVESLAVGQAWDDDVRIILFVVLRPGVVLTAQLQQDIRQTVRRNATPRHVPSKIVAVADIPRTKSGKMVEVAVRKLVNGEDVTNTDALANPEALELFRELPELAVD